MLSSIQALGPNAMLESGFLLLRKYCQEASWLILHAMLCIYSTPI